MMIDNKTFLIDGIFEHTIGDRDCQQCWNDELEVCKGTDIFYCGGLIHTQFGDENSDCNYWLHYVCDKCGEHTTG